MKVLSSEAFYAKNYDYYEEARSGKSSYMGAVDFFVTDNFERGPILDIGCGDGFRALGLFCDRQADIVGMDNCIEMCEMASRNGITTVLHEDIAALSDNTMSRFHGRFGTILCLWNVLGHILHVEERERAMRNMVELLSDGGMLFVDVNNRLNVDQYGLFRSLRNLVAGIFQKEKGVFTLPINDSVTRVYLSSKKEFVDLLSGSGLHMERLVCVNYRNGKIEKNSWHGQLLAVCRKKL
jgi:2-polyprenyl-3-methyl-5-hydroxy-6-metoxy-1,4-benzoquinol methylase